MSYLVAGVELGQLDLLMPSRMMSTRDAGTGTPANVPATAPVQPWTPVANNFAAAVNRFKLNMQAMGTDLNRGIRGADTGVGVLDSLARFIQGDISLTTWLLQCLNDIIKYPTLQDRPTSPGVVQACQNLRVMVSNISKGIVAGTLVPGQDAAPTSTTDPLVQQAAGLMTQLGLLGPSYDAAAFNNALASFRIQAGLPQTAGVSMTDIAALQQMLASLTGGGPGTYPDGTGGGGGGGGMMQTQSATPAWVLPLAALVGAGIIWKVVLKK